MEKSSVDQDDERKQTWPRIVESATALGLESPRQKPRGRRAKFAVLIIMALLLIGSARTIGERFFQARRVGTMMTRNAQQYVIIAHPKRGMDTEATLLPGTLRGSVESPVFARASGYLLRWYADIGTQVEQGQLLAELDTPEIDAEFSQARAQREHAASSLSLAKSSAARWQQLRDRDAVSQQALEERESTYRQDVATLDAAEANVQRLRRLESFKHIVAPYAGVVTQRNVDVGDLIDAGGGTSRPLFALTQVNPLRAYIQLPQAYAQGVTVGTPVNVMQSELPNQTFGGTISHIAGAIKVATRSLEIEVTLLNPEGKLRPGSYVQIALASSVRSNLLVPSNALLFRENAPYMAVVLKNGKVAFRRIRIAHDFGQTLEVESGIDPADQVITNPSDSIAQGDEVVVSEGVKNIGGTSVFEGAGANLEKRADPLRLKAG